MKKITLALLPVFLLFSFSLEASSKVKNKKDGIFYQEIWKGWYQVDTAGQICIYGQEDYSAVTAIDCGALANRPEWRDIITWKNQTPAPSPASVMPEITEEPEALPEETEAPKEMKRKKK